MYDSEITRQRYISISFAVRDSLKDAIGLLEHLTRLEACIDYWYDDNGCAEILCYLFPFKFVII